MFEHLRKHLNEQTFKKPKISRLYEIWQLSYRSLHLTGGRRLWWKACTRYRPNYGSNWVEIGVWDFLL